MNRRSFMKAAGIAAVAPALPIAKAATMTYKGVPIEFVPDLGQYDMIVYSESHKIAAWKLTQHADGSFTTEPIMNDEFYKYSCRAERTI